MTRAGLYGTAMGLVIAAAIGWPAVLIYALIAGPAIGHKIATKPRTSGAPLTTGERRSE